VHLVKTKVSEGHIASIIKGIRIGKLGTKLTITSNRSTLQRNTNVVPSSPIIVILMMEQYVPPKRRHLQEPRGVNILEDGIL
jgi:hypothetical protein